MNNKHRSSMVELIGKIDNDFNIDHSDWIPRVAAWTIDALSQMKCVLKKNEKRLFKINDRIAQGTLLNNCEIRYVYCDKGSVVEEYPIAGEHFNNPHRHHEKFHDRVINEIHPGYHHGHRGPAHHHCFDTNCVPPHFDNGCVFHDFRCHQLPFEECHKEIGVTVNARHPEWNTAVACVTSHGHNHHYIYTPGKIELNFDSAYIVVDGDFMDMIEDMEYDCEIPVIYDNAVLKEAIAMYCMYKMLTRGYKHPVFRLDTNNEAINPYIQWKLLKDKARVSVNNQLQREGKGWSNFFFNYTFMPRS